MNRRAFETAYFLLAPSKDTVGTAHILIDLDHFKKVNDRCGHAIGDRVLINVSKTLLANTRDGDLTSRFGGEEFVVCLPNTDKVQTARIAERIRKAISDIDMKAVECKFPITASIGVCWDRAPVDLTAALKIADEALYRAKFDGRNQVVFDRPCGLYPSMVEAEISTSGSIPSPL